MGHDPLPYADVRTWSGSTLANPHMGTRSILFLPHSCFKMGVVHLGDATFKYRGPRKLFTASLLRLQKWAQKAVVIMGVKGDIQLKFSKRIIMMKKGCGQRHNVRKV